MCRWIVSGGGNHVPCLGGSCLVCTVFLPAYCVVSLLLCLYLWSILCPMLSLHSCWNSVQRSCTYPALPDASFWMTALRSSHHMRSWEKLKSTSHVESHLKIPSRMWKVSVMLLAPRLHLVTDYQRCTILNGSRTSHSKRCVTYATCYAQKGDTVYLWQWWDAMSSADIPMCQSVYSRLIFAHLCFQSRQDWQAAPPGQWMDSSGPRTQRGRSPRLCSRRDSGTLY